MGILWQLLGVCILCSLNQIKCQILEEENEVPAIVEGTLLGFKPCLDESCSDFETNPSRSGDYVQDAATFEQIPSEDDYELQEHLDKFPEYPNKQCISLHPSAVKDLELIQWRHPDVMDIKLNVLEDVIHYAALASSIRSENCSSEAKLLDLFIFAAEEIKQKYMKVTHDNCKYTNVSESEFEFTTTPELTRRSEYLPTEPCPEATPEIKPIEVTKKPCLEKIPPTVETIKPCEDGDEEIEIIAEEGYKDHLPPFVGSVRAIPGVHYPNYSEIPITSFSCDDKYIPGFYADLETGCQVFHVCYEHRRESFLCPLGTTFNQPILACDYWYSSNCSLAPSYYEVNVKTDVSKEEEHIVEDFISAIGGEADATGTAQEEILDDIAKFLPVKAKVVEFPKFPKVQVSTKVEKNVEDVASEIFNKIIVTATGVASVTRDVIKKIPEPSQQYEPIPVFKLKPVTLKAPLKAAVTTAKLAAAVPAVVAKAKLAAAIPAAKVAVAKSVLPVVAKAKLASAALPIVAAKTKVAAAIPVVAKAKVVGAALPIVAAKTKVAAAVPVVAKAKIVSSALPVVAAKTKVAAAVPVVAKTKIAGAAKLKVAAAVPIGKAKVAAAAVPIAAKVKLSATVPKVVAKASVPVLKSKLVASAVPLAKAKFAAPVIKGKGLKAAGIPLVKAKMLAVPLAKGKLAGSAPLLKAKLVKAAAISPLTKKALALGYMKLLKTKKLALMG